MEWMKSLFQIFICRENWTLDNVLAALSILLVSVGGIFALFQWLVSNRIRRAEFIHQIIEKLRFHQDMADTMHMIDYDDAWYDMSFHGGELEGKVDSFLAYLSYICYMKKMKIISKKEFSILQYELIRTCQSPCVRHYLWNLYHFAKAQHTTCTFQYLIDYGISSHLIDREKFEDPAAYEKYLNF